MTFVAKGKKKHIQNQRQTNTSHCPTKTISKSVAYPLNNNNDDDDDDDVDTRIQLIHLADSEQ